MTKGKKCIKSLGEELWF